MSGAMVIATVASAVIGAASAQRSRRAASKQNSLAMMQRERQEKERREMERRQLTQKDEEIGSAERVRYGRGEEDSAVGVDDLLIPRAKGSGIGIGGSTSKPKTGLGFKI